MKRTGRKIKRSERRGREKFSFSFLSAKAKQKKNENEKKTPPLLPAHNDPGVAQRHHHGREEDAVPDHGPDAAVEGEADWVGSFFSFFFVGLKLEVD